MASQFGVYTRATPRAAVQQPHKAKKPLIFSVEPPGPAILAEGRRRRIAQRIRVSNGGDSYLDMWKGAVDRDRKAIEFRKIVENTAASDDGGGDGDVEESPEELEKKSSEFQKILQVSTEERDRVQRMQVIDRAAAAIAAARAILNENSPPQKSVSSDSDSSKTQILKAEGDQNVGALQGGKKSSSSFLAESGTAQQEAPGPNFWSWTPPPDNDRISDDVESNLKLAKETYPYPAKTNPVIEKEQSIDNLSIPFESKLFESSHNPPLPPLQSLMEIENVEVPTSSIERPLEEKHELGVLFSAHAAEVAHALDKEDEALSRGINPDGSRWWKEQGVQRRPDGVVCRWTLTRGVSADKAVEWEEKYWEAADQFDHKELGSEKSGRDAAGNVWREFWKETMWQERGLVHLEKTADKWGKNGRGDEWQEKWWERYDAAGKAEKWAHKWCSIDPETPVEVGHAHIWHERWGEKYDGHGGSMKYTDKWAERSEGDGWTKWGDKWDEHFDQNGQGIKQGEAWWEGKYGERWNRTWGEHHNGSGWVHKYGKSSSGEHWDTHVEQETWFERFPHYGFQHCFDNSVQLREVQKPSERS